MIRLAIVDDDNNDSSVLYAHCERFMQEEENRKYSLTVKTFADGNVFLSEHKKNLFDAVFLDIDMPLVSGMSVAETLRQTDQEICIVFITNMAQYALDGYRVDALDFAVKPVGYYDIALKLNKIVKNISRRPDKALVIKTTEGDTLRLPYSVITYVEVMSHYLVYHTKTETYHCRGSMKEVEDILLPYSFARLSKSYLVNLKYVSGVNKKEMTVTVFEDTLFMTRTMKDSFLDAFYTYLGGQ